MRSGTESEHCIEAELPDERVDGGLSVLTAHLGEHQPRAVTLVAAAEGGLLRKQLAGAVDRHGSSSSSSSATMPEWTPWVSFSWSACTRSTVTTQSEMSSNSLRPVPYCWVVL